MGGTWWNNLHQVFSIRCPHLCPQCCSCGHTARPPGGCTGLTRGAQKAAGKSYRILLAPGCTQVFWHALNSECVYHYRIDTRGQLMNYMHDVTLYENFSLRATSAAPAASLAVSEVPPPFCSNERNGNLQTSSYLYHVDMLGGSTMKIIKTIHETEKENATK